MLLLCDELVVHGAAESFVYSCLLLLVIDTEINCSYEFCAEDLPPGCRFGLPFCFIVEAHRVGFSFSSCFPTFERDNCLCCVGFGI